MAILKSLSESRCTTWRRHCCVVGWMVVSIIAFLVSVPACTCLAAAPLSGDKPAKSEAPTKVKIEIKEDKTPEGAKVEVEVSGDKKAKKVKSKKKASDAAALVELAEEKRAARRTKVYQVGIVVGRAIDRWGANAATYLGWWVNAEVFNGIKWIKLAVCLVLLLAAFAVERLIALLIQLRLRRIPDEERGTTWRGMPMEALAKPLSLFLWSYGMFFALAPLYGHFEDPDGSNVVFSVIAGACDFGATFSIIWFLYGLAARIEITLSLRAEASDSKFDRVLAPLLGRTLRTFVVLLGGIVIIQNLTGLAVAPLLASLGLGGFAIALAAKDSISNFFGTITIFLDRPFKVGDRIVLDKFDGFVESVGYRSTRIRTFAGSLVTVPNEKIMKSILENIGSRPYIRWRADIGLRFDTPPDKVERAVKILHEVLDDHEGCKEDLPPRIYLEGLQNGCLNIAIFAWYHPPEYWDYMAWVEKISLTYLRRFACEGIEIAIPSRQVFMDRNSTEREDMGRS
ncbi:mechanosensitive ion channel family protein [Thermodesulfobacteriota bacterium]